MLQTLRFTAVSLLLVSVLENIVQYLFNSSLGELNGYQTQVTDFSRSFTAEHLKDGSNISW